MIRRIYTDNETQKETGIILLSFTENQEGSKTTCSRQKEKTSERQDGCLTCLGFTQDVAATISNVQGVDSIDELKFLNDKEVEGLCNNIRKPGGMMPNPNAGVQGEPAMIRNPGQGVSARAENNLKLCCYFIRHRERISRSVTADQITLANVRALRDLRDAETNHVDHEPTPKLMDSKNWPKTIEGIVEYLRGCLGVTKIPLSYVVHDHIEVTPEANDPETN